MAFNYNKWRDFCGKFRILVGVSLVSYALISGNMWFYLGILPLFAGAIGFCPVCIISKKCT